MAPAFRSSLAIWAGLVAVQLVSTPWATALPSGQELGGVQLVAADDHWVDTWTSMPQLVEQDNLPPSPFGVGHSCVVSGAVV